jgi:hypothetical protein
VVIDIRWPETTTRVLEGEHDTNVTGARIMEDGSIGHLVFSYLWKDQPPAWETLGRVTTLLSAWGLIHLRLWRATLPHR